MTRLAPVAGLLPGAVLAATLTALAGCGFANFGPMERTQADDLAAWSERPLLPDPSLAQIAIGPDGPCLMTAIGEEPSAAPPQILVQDRRTVDTAVFLVAGADRFGSCTVTRNGGASGAGWGSLPGPMTGQLTIDDQGRGTLGNGEAAELGGRIALPAARVVVQLDDGRSVVASVSNGFWLAWWPATTEAARAVALDSDGRELASVVVPDMADDRQ